jgi:hypothetical protein
VPAPSSPDLSLPVPNATDAASVAADDARFLLAYLADRDLPCPRCGYNLRRLSSDRCPECGDVLVLQVGSADPQMGAYAALLVATAAGLGGSLFFGSVAAVYAPASWWSGASGILLIVEAVLAGAGLAAAVRGRRRIRRASPAAQRALAIAAVGGVLVLSTMVVAVFK